MGNRRGFSGLMLIIIILLVALGGAALVFEFFGKLAEKEDESEPALYEAALQAEENLKNSPSPTAEKVCYDQKVFWKWQTGGQNGQAQVYFSPDNKSSVGSLLDKDGKKTVYTFDMEEDGRTSLGVANSDAKAYGEGSIECDSIYSDD